MRKALVLAACLLVTPVFAPSSARAEPTAAERATARELYFAGLEKRAAGDLQGAMHDFQAADSIMGVPTTALKLGEVEIALGLLVEANESLERATRYTAPGDLPATFAAAQERAHTLLDQVRPRLSKLVLAVEGAEATTPRLVLALDGRVLPAAVRSSPFLVNPGLRTLTVTVDGRTLEERRVQMREGQSERVPVLVPPPDLIGEKPSEARTAMPLPQPPPSASPPSLFARPTFVAGLAMAGAGAVVGAVAGGFALDRGANLAELCPDARCPPSAHDALSEAETFAAVSTGGLVVAGVGAALALGTWILAPSKTNAGARLPADLGPASLRVSF